jgi:alpha-mannosidase
MHKHPDLTARRIERFLRHELYPRLWERRIPMQAAVFQPDGPWPRPEDPLTPTHDSRLTTHDYTPIEPGFTWGPVWSDAWFRFTGAIPAEWKGESVVARMDVGAEAIVWNGDEPMQGMDGNHAEYRLTDAAAGGEAITLTVRASGMNPHVSLDGRPADPPEKPFTFRYAALAVYDAGLWALFHDMKMAALLMKEMPQNEPRFGQLLYALNEAVNAWDPDDRASIARCREIVGKVYNRPAGASAHRVSAIGHAHIDSAWLWPLERTQQKCLHTFATATRTMDQYPEYKFICSQAVQYEWVKCLAPKLYERIKEKVKAGQWEITGSMWVEADCNITGGESLVRQILLAKNFWLDEFGVETVDVWLPDVFGYAAALPQIMHKAGIKYFLTQKISWNQTNKFPHHTFLWQGIDGTRIFSHFPPVDTYNAMMTPGELMYNVRNFREHDRAVRSLYVYGFGDGGGGPTVEMIENMRRLADIEGMPKVTPEFARDFFQKAEAEAKDLPVWVGELYLELHRGTLTTQARNKRGNRKSEFLLRDAEFLACISPAGLAAYPRAELDRAWKLVLLNQFHDIIPGSSVNEVYKDSARDYAEIAQIGEKVVGDALAALAALVNTEGMRCPVLVVRNYDDFAYSEPVCAPIPDGATPQSVRYGEEAPAPVQVVEEDGRRCALFQEQTTEEGHGYTVYDLSDATHEEINTFLVTERLLDNGLLRVEFDENGLITRLWDNLRAREVLEPGAQANQLQLFEDRPLNWDAWDVDIFYQEKGRVLTELDRVEVLEEGPVRGAIRFTRSFGNSKLVQTVRLARDRNRLEFVTEVDWHEEHKLLKAAFPVAVNSSRATYEIQYGCVERPTHYNTSWDLARFEVAAQKWVDIGEGDYGVALLNDCKYGHDTQGSTLRLTLLRAPKAPDPEADMGHHTFTYALLPHYGDFRRGEVVEQAYHLNAPPRALLLPPGRSGPLPKEQSFFSVDREGIVIEAVKKAEKEDAVIVRLYDAHNERGPVRLRASLPVKSAHLCDLLERDEAELPVEDGAVSFYIRPFEIVTVKLRL